MNFLETIFHKLRGNPQKAILKEVVEGNLKTVTCGELSDLTGRARVNLQKCGLHPGDRCVLLGSNDRYWVALDLAIMAEGAIVVPLYPRQGPQELISIMKDCEPSLICVSSAPLRDDMIAGWPEAPRILLFDQVFSMIPGSERADGNRRLPDIVSNLKETSGAGDPPTNLDTQNPVTIIYTSGTSGNPKGVTLNVGNVDFMLERTTDRLEELMRDIPEPGDHRVFHYLPFCFAGSWILLLTCLFRNNCLMLSTDLTKLAEEMRLAQPHYFLNVPALLERMKSSIITQLRDKGQIAWTLFSKGESAWQRRHHGQPQKLDGLWLALATTLVFPKIRQRLGPNLRALICGSAPLAEETQLFFQMIGIPVLQVYGLTETTAICTMDDVQHVTPGRVGPSIPGIEMKLGDNNEILVRGPNIFPGYWNRPEETAQLMKSGWFHTGDQGEVDEQGNWKIIGRLKNLIVTSGGHNISPEPIEQMLLNALPETEQVMVVGNNRKFLSVIVSGDIASNRVESALNKVNQQLPHYKQVRKFIISSEPFSAENGLLTANRKLRRTMIEARYKEQIEKIYSD